MKVNHLVCLTTTGSLRNAEKIARALVKKRLVACVNILPGVVSFYLWKKRLCRDREVILIMKTSQKKVAAMEKEIGKIHTYELPEFVVLPMTSGSKRYLEWIDDSITTGQETVRLAGSSTVSRE